MNKIYKRVLSLLIALTLLFPSIAVHAADFQVKEGAALVADQDTRYITVFEQDPETRLITATIKIHNNNSSEPLVITGISASIRFSDKVSPYNMTANTPFKSGTLIDDAVLPFGTILNNLDKLSPQILKIDANNRIIGAKIGTANASKPLVVAPGATSDVYRYYFMPEDGADFSINMFDYESNYYSVPRRTSTWIGNGGGYMAASQAGVGSTLGIHTLQIYPDAYKIHVKRLAPVGLLADNDLREVLGYDDATMEWCNTIDGVYESTVPVIGDDATTIYVRTKGEGAYGFTSPDGVYASYKKYIPSDAVSVEFEDAFFPADVETSKTSENSRQDGTTHVGDTIKYTITAENKADSRSTWADVVVTDKLPDGVTFVADSVKVDGVSHTCNYDPATGTLTVSLGDIIGGVKKVVVFEATVDADAYGKVIKNSAVVTGKDGVDGEEIIEKPEEPGDGREIVEKSEPPHVDTITEGDKEITGKGEPGAEIIVTFPDGEKETVIVDPDGNWKVDVPDDVNLTEGEEIDVVQVEQDKDPSDTINIIVDGRPPVVPVLSKTAENISRADGTNHVGDTLKYTITIKNAGDLKSLWENAVVIDKLPDGLDFADDSVALDGISSLYDFTAGTLTVEIGDIAAGIEKVLTFEVIINEDAYGKAIENTALVKGKDIEEEVTEPGGGSEVADKSDSPVIDAVTEGDREVTGKGVAGAEITVTFPGGGTADATVKSDGTWSVDVPSNVNLVRGDVVTAVQTEPGEDPSDPTVATVASRPNIGDNNAVVIKTSENISRADGTNRVGDILEYTVVVRNNGDPKSLWINAVMTDTLPTEITLTPDSVKLDGETISYDFTSGVLTVAVGDIAGGKQKTVTFQAVVNENAYGQSVVNSVQVKGKDGGDGEEIIIETEEEEGKTVIDKSPAPEFDEVNEGDRVITGYGVAGAAITLHYEGSIQTSSAVVGDDGKWSANVPEGVNLIEGNVVKAVQTVEPLDPSDAAETIVQARKNVVPYMEKVSENKTSTDEFTHVGDKILYTVTIGNEGSPKSKWVNVVMTDKLPDGVTYVPDSVLLDGVAPVNYSYNDAQRLLSVNVGDIAGGVQKVVTFEVVISADAYGMDIKNSASVLGKNNGNEDIGTEVTEDGGQNVMDKSAAPSINEVTRGDETISGTGVPGATIVITFPNGQEETTVVDQEGNWIIDVPAGVELKNNDVINAVQTEPDKEASDPVQAIVNDKSYRAVTGNVFPITPIDEDLGIEVVVELRTTFNTPGADGLRTKAVWSGIGNDGTFTIENVPFGTYVLYIHRPGYLTRAMLVTISESDPDMIILTSPGTSENGVFMLTPGDSNEDFIVDVTDVMLVTGSQNKGYGDTGYLVNYDFNADGFVDVQDIMMVLAQLNKTVLDYPGSSGVDFES